MSAQRRSLDYQCRRSRRSARSPTCDYAKWSSVKFKARRKKDDKQRHKPEEIVLRLRQVDVPVGHACGCAPNTRTISGPTTSFRIAPTTAEPPQSMRGGIIASIAVFHVASCFPEARSRFYLVRAAPFFVMRAIDLSRRSGHRTMESLAISIKCDTETRKSVRVQHAHGTCLGTGAADAWVPQ